MLGRNSGSFLKKRSQFLPVLPPPCCAHKWRSILHPRPAPTFGTKRLCALPAFASRGDPGAAVSTCIASKRITPAQKAMPIRLIIRIRFTDRPRHRPIATHIAPYRHDLPDVPGRLKRQSFFQVARRHADHIPLPQPKPKPHRCRPINPAPPKMVSCFMGLRVLPGYAVNIEVIPARPLNRDKNPLPALAVCPNTALMG